MKISVSVMFMACLLASTAVFAQSNVDEMDKYGWSENVGWANFRPSSMDGVVVGDDFLSGYAWLENVGWLNLGDGLPDSGPYYRNDSAADFGVNNDGHGKLSGYAWGENIGWVCFDTSSSGGSQVTIDSSGDFSGHAWGENVGWINMASGYGVNTSWREVVEVDSPTPYYSPTPASSSAKGWINYE